MSTPKSNTLFHFTPSLEFLKGILKNGFYPRYCLEDISWLGAGGIDFLGMPMVCFCDIPISRISEHTGFYGSYGLGVTKEWGLKSSLQPLIYTPSTGVVTKLMSDLLNLPSNKLDEINAILNFDPHFQAILSMMKPLSGNMVVKGEVVAKDFYQENEWRFAPSEFRDVYRDDIDARRAELNAEVEKHALRFTANDIRYIFVSSEAEIPEIFDFIQNNLGHWPLNDIKILTSRITSLETLGKDV